MSWSFSTKDCRINSFITIVIWEWRWFFALILTYVLFPSQPCVYLAISSSVGVNTRVVLLRAVKTSFRHGVEDWVVGSSLAGDRVHHQVSSSIWSTLIRRGVNRYVLPSMFSRDRRTPRGVKDGRPSGKPSMAWRAVLLGRDRAAPRTIQAATRPGKWSLLRNQGSWYKKVRYKMRFPSSTKVVCYLHIILS